jgi:hypothetical protein
MIGDGERMPKKELAADDADEEDDEEYGEDED